VRGKRAFSIKKRGGKGRLRPDVDKRKKIKKKIVAQANFTFEGRRKKRGSSAKVSSTMPARKERSSSQKNGLR